MLLWLWLLLALQLLSLLPHHGLFKLVSKSDALDAVSFILNQDLIDLGHFDTPFDLLNLRVSFIELPRLLPDRPLVTIDELLCLGMRLLTVAAVWRVRSVHHLLRVEGASLGLGLMRVEGGILLLLVNNSWEGGHARRHLTRW